MTVSVVIPAHNEALILPDLLASLARQTHLANEVFVVCDRCTDNTAEVARANGANVLTVDYGSIAPTRNAGIRQATGNIVACFDADTVLASETVLAQVSQTTADFGGFHMVPDLRYTRSFSERLWMHQWLSGINQSARRLGNFVGTGMFFRRSLGLIYDEDWGWAEDIEFCERLRVSGATWSYLPGAPLVYCDRRFLEHGYAREIQRRLLRGFGHLIRSRSRVTLSGGGFRPPV